MSTASLHRESADITSLNDLRQALAPIRENLLEHALYQAVNTIPHLRLFMGHHVFAVWDFMCLAKRLQRDLTSMEELWLPPRRPSLARFINSVIHGEESDVDGNGQAASHFDLYLTAMQEVGATVEPAQRFIELLRDGCEVSSSLAAVGASKTVQKFVAHTLETVKTGTTIEVLAAFLFGREDLIPEMFSRLLPQWGDAVQAPGFTYYVKRHIELDGDEHGPAGLRALAEMAGGDETVWQAATRAAVSAIGARIELWDGVYSEIAHA
jgi:hypothetical protein